MTANCTFQYRSSRWSGGCICRVPGQTQYRAACPSSLRIRGGTCLAFFSNFVCSLRPQYVPPFLTFMDLVDSKNPTLVQTGRASPPWDSTNRERRVCSEYTVCIHTCCMCIPACVSCALAGASVASVSIKHLYQTHLSLKIDPGQEFSCRWKTAGIFWVWKWQQYRVVRFRRIFYTRRNWGWWW